jgi:hypothetical protein
MKQNTPKQDIEYQTLPPVILNLENIKAALSFLIVQHNKILVQTKG